VDDFALEEYRCLRTEMMHHAEKTFEIERYTATALAVIYSWLLSRTGPAPSALWILPLPIPVAALLRSWALRGQIRVLASYLLQLEQRLYSSANPKLGWEQHLLNARAKVKWGVPYRATLALWMNVALIVLTCVLSYWGLDWAEAARSQAAPTTSVAPAKAPAP